jgi:hypothetical protein
VTRYRASGDALAATLSDGAVLLHLHSKRYFSLNESGTRIWELLQQETEIDAIVAALVAEFDVSAAAAREAVEGLIRELLDERLIETAEP